MGLLTVLSVSSSSFLWEGADGDAGENVDYKWEGPAATTGFSSLPRKLNELEHVRSLSNGEE